MKQIIVLIGVWVLAGCAGSGGGSGGNNPPHEQKPDDQCRYAACGRWISEPTKSDNGTEIVQFILTEKKADIVKTCNFSDHTSVSLTLSARIRMHKDSIDVLNSDDKSVTGKNGQVCEMNFPEITLDYRIESANVLVFSAWGAQVGRLTRQKGKLPLFADISLANAENVPQNAEDLATDFNF